jgi:hypothetical protein
MRKPRGVIISNCQSQPLKHILSLVCNVTRFDGFGVHTITPSARTTTVEQFVEVARKDYDLVLSIPLSEEFGPLALDRLRQTFCDKFIATIPNFYFSGLHPDLTYIGGLGHRVVGPLEDYHSKIAIYGFATGMSVDQCTGLYCDDTYARLGYYDEFEKSLAELRRRDTSLDVPFTDELPALLKSDLCFFSVNHPTNFLLRAFCIKVAAWLDDHGVVTRVPWSWPLGSLPNHLAQHVIFPVFPEVAAACELAFPGSYTFKPPTIGDSPVACLNLREFVEQEYKIFGNIDRQQFLGAPQVRTVIDLCSAKLLKGQNRLKSGEWHGATPVPTADPRQIPTPPATAVLRLSEECASIIRKNCDENQVWAVDFQRVLVEASSASQPSDACHSISADAHYTPTDFIPIYLSALLAPNSEAALIRLGQNAIDRYKAVADTTTLVMLTNAIFKSLTLVPPPFSAPELRTRCVTVNFALHVAANWAIHSLQAAKCDYFNGANEINRFLKDISPTLYPQRLCFVFLTDSYFENFCIWIDVFNVTTRGSVHLVVVTIGENAADRIHAKMHSSGFTNYTVHEYMPTQRLSACGNGEHLYYLWYFKIKLVRHFVSSGFDVIYSDLDSFWLKNFCDIWDSGLNAADMIFMSSADMPLYAVSKWGTTPCAGFFALRASKKVERCLAEWERWVEIMFDDQIGLAQMLLSHGVEWTEPSDSVEWRRAVWLDDDAALESTDGQVNLVLLNPRVARRVGRPDLQTIEESVIWHPRWNAFTEDHAEIAAKLLFSARGGDERERRHPVRTITGLVNQYGSDKGTTAGAAHHYSLLYDLLFADMKDRPIDLLEIGLAVGGPELGNLAERRAISPSVQMWLSYFSKAKIYGFDISDFSHMQHERFHFVQGDCGNEGDLKRLTKLTKNFDIIIDDASHASYHQQNALRTLFETVKPGGFYIIEDLHWQSPYFEGTLPQVPKTWEFLTEFFIAGRYLDNPLLPRYMMEKMEGQIQCFGNFHDFSGQTTMPKIIVIKKKGVPPWISDGRMGR